MRAVLLAGVAALCCAAGDLDAAIKNAQAGGYVTALATRCYLIPWEDMLTARQNFKEELAAVPKAAQSVLANNYSLGQSAADHDTVLGPGVCVNAERQMAAVNGFVNGSRTVVKQYFAR